MVGVSLACLVVGMIQRLQSNVFAQHLALRMCFWTVPSRPCRSVTGSPTPTHPDMQATFLEIQLLEDGVGLRSIRSGFACEIHGNLS